MPRICGSGPEILKTNVDSYRKLRNTLRWMLGSLAHFRPEHRVAEKDMPELERLMLSELARLDRLVRDAYAAFDFKRVYFALFNFMTVDLSAFYFDIRKDTLYCDPASSKARHAALTVIDRLFDCLALWLAPMLPFTTEEAWARAPWRSGLGASQSLPGCAGGLARRGAGEAVGQSPGAPPPCHRRA